MYLFIYTFIYSIIQLGQETELLKSISDVGSTFEVAVDESKRPKEWRNNFRVYKDISIDLMGSSGNFIKLNQDEI